MRPRPIVKGFYNIVEHEAYRDGGGDPKATIPIEGHDIPLRNSKLTEIWVNVTNDGKTSIKRMRARARFVILPQVKDRFGGGERKIWTYEEYMKSQELEKKVVEPAGAAVPSFNFIDKPVPLKWKLWEGGLSPEIDLAPKSDEANARLFSVWKLRWDAIEEMKKQGLLKGSNAPRETIAIGVSDSLPFWSGDLGTTRFVVYAKFWLTAENLADPSPIIFVFDLDKDFELGAMFEKHDINSDNFKGLDGFFNIRRPWSGEIEAGWTR
jgi:hypothetical protein